MDALGIAWNSVASAGAAAARPFALSVDQFHFKQALRSPVLEAELVFLLVPIQSDTGAGKPRKPGVHQLRADFLGEFANHMLVVDAIDKCEKVGDEADRISGSIKTPVGYAPSPFPEKHQTTPALETLSIVSECRDASTFELQFSSCEASFAASASKNAAIPESTPKQGGS
ncbi:MAG TPA: hypothetical protein VHB77_19065, partial [Planctomycetaceae bacterium]|nr:hypothetical protein [Planctomycetaceae bacterium]